MATPKSKEVRKIDCVAMTLILTASSVSDLREYRIPNIWILLGWLTGLVFRLHREGADGLLQGIICLAGSIILLWPLFRLHAVGAGDIKLLSVVAVFYGMAFWVRTGILFVFLAGIISMVQMICKKNLKERFVYCIRYFLYDRKSRYYHSLRDGKDMVIPMAPVLAVAYYLVYCLEQFA